MRYRLTRPSGLPAHLWEGSEPVRSPRRMLLPPFWRWGPSTTGAEAVAVGDASCLMQIGRGLSGQPAAPLDAIGGLRAQLRTTAIALHAAAHAGNP